MQLCARCCTVKHAVPQRDHVNLHCAHLFAIECRDRLVRWRKVWVAVFVRSWGRIAVLTVLMYWGGRGAESVLTGPRWTDEGRVGCRVVGAWC